MRREDFDNLYAEHAQALYGFLAFRANDQGLAEDLLAETFERALRARRRFDPRKGSRRAWLFAIALNCLRDHKRRQAAERRALERAAAGPAGPAAPDPVETVEQRALIAGALSVLSEEEREAIALRFGADLSVPEIARLTGLRLSTAEGRVYRALQKLRDALGDSESG